MSKKTEILMGSSNLKKYQWFYILLSKEEAGLAAYSHH